MMTQELDLEDPLAIVQRLNADDGATLVASLTEDEAQTLVDRLKAGADKYWAINPNRSLEMADTIIKIADGRDNLSHKALGMMARGDALKILGEFERAWQELESSGTLFLTISDDLGWARTRIGQLYLCVDVKRVAQALEDGKKALQIFASHNADALQMRLELNIAGVYYTLGDQSQALDYYNSALTKALALGTSEQQFVGLIYLNLGSVYSDLSDDIRKADSFFQKALEFFTRREETKNIALAKHNLAYLALRQGKYLQALHIFYDVLDVCDAAQLPFDANHIYKVIVECNVLLNRFSEAKELAQKVVSYFQENGAAYDEAFTLLHLATANTELVLLEEANDDLNKAEDIFTGLGIDKWIATTRLRRGQLALRLGDMKAAYTSATDAAAFFKSSGQQINYGRAMLLEAHVRFAQKQLDLSKQCVEVTLTIAKTSNILLLRYDAHLLLGHIAKAKSDFMCAIRHYNVAVATIERVQKSLTITLRSEFLEDKNEALESLIALYIQSDNKTDEYKMSGTVLALETLERTKSQVFFNYVTNRQLLRWPQDDPKVQVLIQELEQLRAEHHWWHQKLYVEVSEDLIEENKTVESFEKALEEITIRERQMRAITEQLYLKSIATAAVLPSSTPTLQEIQGKLDEGTLLIEFYHDSKNVWIFTIDVTTSLVQESPALLSVVEQYLDLLHFHINTVLSMGSNMPQANALVKQGQFLLQRLFEQLLTPIVARLHNYRRIIFVPYGSLHYVPFHLLFTGKAYLLEDYEVVVLPAASYVTRIRPSRSSAAKVIAHSHNGALPYALDEAHSIHDLFGGSLYIEDAATRTLFQEAPSQILHIATHAEYRQQQPDLSYIELADGYLFTDDLFQQDMSYELVTLSACETGRSQVASRDELIGLGRGFLYAGAGALVTSLWRVIDDITLRLMEHFYRELHAGASKAAALRAAQLTILKENPKMHPAYWGAFQLVGDPGPLSSNPKAKNPRWIVPK